VRQLDTMGGKHLVLVRYSREHHPGNEWVYNGADIDASPVVWARELDRESNARLIEYFGDRHIWLVEPDAPTPRLVPYSEAPPRPMAFVQFGAPGIRVLQSAGEIRRRVLAEVAAHQQPPPLTCDVWNFYFTAVTGIGGPEVDQGCFAGNQRGQLVSFDHWFEWYRGQRR
jgi:hypothetical protein